jgi:hypothetical protein
MRPQTVAEFVEQFLPEQYVRLCEQGGPALSQARFGLNVVGAGQWSLIAGGQQLEIQRNLTADRVLTASVTADDFERLALGEALSEERPPLFIGQRMLRVDTQTLTLVKNVPGSILVRIADQGTQRRVLLTPGDRAIDFENAECAVECDHVDLIAVRSGQVPPLELFLAGKLRVLGDAQLALALGGLFV